MPPVPMHPMETILRARKMYEEGARVRDICAATGLSVGTLYYHLDGHSLPGLAPPRLPRRRDVEGSATASMPSRGRKKLAARLFRAAERQARKLEFALTWDYQRKEDRALDLAALRELTRILRDLSVLEDSAHRAEPWKRGEAVERKEAVAVEGRAVFVRREKRG
jgi:AcrR family transcriptional regulator